MQILTNLFGNVLYYSGCMYKYVLRDENEKYKEILKKSGVDFIVAPEEFCCGSPVLKAGYKKDFEKLKEQNLKIFKSLSVKEIIAACPACRLILKEQYGLKVRHVTEVLYSDRDAKFFVSMNEERKIYYHDPCHLGRLGGIYDQPRKILKARGYEVLEFSKNRNQSQCCGAGGGVKANFSELAGKIASNALSELLKDAIITSSCPMCYAHFKEIAKSEKDSKIEVVEFSQLL